MSDDFAFSAKENYRNYPLRRQSAISDFKPKVRREKLVKRVKISILKNKFPNKIFSPCSKRSKFLHLISTHFSFTKISFALFYVNAHKKGLKVESCKGGISMGKGQYSHTQRVEKFRFCFISQSQREYKVLLRIF